MKKYLIFVFPLLLLLAYCHKPPEPEPNPEPDLPAATQEGKGTIGCYINGKPWVPKPYVAIAISPFLKASFNSWDENRFYLKGIKINSNTSASTTFESIMLLSVKKLKIGNNLIDTINTSLSANPIFRDYLVSDINRCSAFDIDINKVRILTIRRLDTSLNIISGTFEFTAFNPCGDTLRFTKGRFDTNF